MIFNRRNFIKTGTMGATSAMLLPNQAFAKNRVQIKVGDTRGLEDGSFESMIVDKVLKALSNPVIIQSVEVLETQGKEFCRVTDVEGNQGITGINGKRYRHTKTIFNELIAPFFLQKDARYIAQFPKLLLQQERNYKYVGLPLWNAFGCIEIAIWDLLGTLANVPVYTFLGEKQRDSYPIYVSSLEREKPYTGETELVLETLEATGAEAVKFKVGGRMKNVEPYITRTNEWVPYMRQQVGEDVTLYVDGNSSYTAQEAVEVLKLLEAHGVQFFEEPCYWQDLWSHKLVKEAATTCKIAGGEQDFSYDQFKLMAHIGAMDTLQPDAFYHGGLVRTLKISHLAHILGLEFTPHSPKAGPMAAAPNQIFAVAPQLSNHQEYRVMGHKKQKKWHSPVMPMNGALPIFENPGLGMTYDDTIWKQETILWTSNNN